MADAPGNILLKKGEGNLPKSSVANISQVMTIDKSDLARKMGQVDKKRVEQIVRGFEFLLRPRIL